MAPKSRTLVGVVPAGRKNDSGKLRYDLIPELVEEEIAKVITYGATEYGDNNWRSLANPEGRYYAAARRHMQEWRKGILTDPATGFPHLAHAAVNLIFLLELTRKAP